MLPLNKHYPSIKGYLHASLIRLVRHMKYSVNIATVFGKGESRLVIKNVHHTNLQVRHDDGMPNMQVYILSK